MTPLLEIKGVTKKFGGLTAVQNVSFGVDRGEIVGLIGPNGAGKTTLFNVITGLYKPTSGEIKFNGKVISGLKPYQICKRGICRTFQIVKPFRGMTTLDNVIVGVLYGRDTKTANMEETRRKAMEILEFLGLSEKANVSAESLTIADLKRLEVARALGTKPELLLVDEMMSGLNPTETMEAMSLLGKINSDKKITILLIEHVMKAIMEVSSRVVVLSHGEKIAEGRPEEIATNQKVIEAYLG